MIAAANLLASWLTPALWLALPTFIENDGPGGLWVALAVVVIPLTALAIAPPVSMARDPGSAEFSATVLLLVAALLTSASLVLAGDLAAQLGAPRWQGIAVAAIAAGLVSTPRRARTVVPGLLLLVGIALAVSLAALVREAGVAPLAAWERVATQPAFRFPAASTWVTTGRDLALGNVPLVFDEEHRVTAPSGGVLRTRSVDGGRASDREWVLAPGQTVVFRAGDQLLPPVSSPVRFEAGKRIPGSPPSGAAWAQGGATDWPRALDLHFTLLIGGLALWNARMPIPVSRRVVWLVGGGLVAIVLWAQGWAVYGLLSAPDLLVGGGTAERSAGLRALALDRLPSRETIAGAVLAAALASFIASSIALRGRVVALSARHSADHEAVWLGMFALAGLVSLWPVDPWLLALAALGTAAAALGPAILWPPESPAAGTVAGAVGLVVFALLAAITPLGRLAPDLVRVDRPAWLAAAWELALEHPVPASVLAGAAMLWIARVAARR